MPMMRKLLRPMTALLMLAALPLPSFADSPLADKLPADTVVYVGWRGSDALGQTYDKSTLKGLLDSIELKKLIEMGMTQANADAAGDLKKLAGIKLVEKLAPSALKNPAAIYFGGIVDFKAAQPVPKLAIILQCGKADAATFAGDLQLAIDNNPDKKPTDPPTTVKAIGDYLLVTVGDSADIATRLADPDNKKALDSSLAGSKDFQAVEAQTGKSPAMRVYVNGSQLVKVIDEAVMEKGPPQLSTNWPKVADALGIDGFKSLGMAGEFDGANWKTSIFVGMDAKRSGLMTFMDNPSLSPWALKAVPKNAVWAGVVRVNGTRIMNEIRSAAARIDDNAPQMMDRGLTAFTNMTGVNFEQDILTNFGDEAVYYGTKLDDMRLVAQVKDGAALELAITTLTNFATRIGGRAGVKVEAVKDGDVTINTVNWDGGGFAWTVRENVFILANEIDGVKNAVTHFKTGGEDLSKNPAFAGLVTQLGVKNYSSFSYGDLQALGTETYPLLQQVMELNRRESKQPKSQVPPPAFEKVKPFLGPALGVRWSDKDGFHAVSSTPFPFSDMLSGEWGVQYKMRKLMMTQRDRATAMASAGNLRSIGTGAAIYAADNKDEFPKDLQTLIHSQAVSPGTLIRNKASLPEDWNDMTAEKQMDWAVEHSDFVFVGGGKADANAAKRVLAYDKFEGHEVEKVNVVFGDGHVESMTVAELKEKLK